MDGRLKSAAEQGNIDMLYDLIRENPKVLDDIDEVPFIETPLHVAASGGKISFAMEIVRLKPSFSRKLNKDGFSPMHLALFNGQYKMVLRFVDHESRLVRVQGKEGKTPLHHVAEQGDVYLLAKFLWACPTCIQDVTVHGETALHIAVKNRKVEALDVLLGGLLTGCSSLEKESIIINRKDVQGKTALHIAIATNQVQGVKLLLKSEIDVNTEDDQGKTALHIATATNQVEVVKLLLKCVIDVNRKDEQGKTALHIATATNQVEVVKMLVKSGIDVNVKDDEGQTALDILNPHNSRQIEEILLRPRTLKSRLHLCLSNYFLGPEHLLMSNLSFKDRFEIRLFRSRKYMDNDTRNVILVVATLILTATYQAALTPPGGLWQDDSKSISTNNNTTGITNTTTNIHYTNYNDGANSTSESQTHKAGSIIMSHGSFLPYIILNSLTHVAATLVILVLLPRDYVMTSLLAILLYLFFGCSMVSWTISSPDQFNYVVCLCLVIIVAVSNCLAQLFILSRKFDQTTPHKII